MSTEANKTRLQRKKAVTATTVVIAVTAVGVPIFAVMYPQLREADAIPPWPVLLGLFAAAGLGFLAIAARGRKS